jgi:uncharacterized protein (TIGR02246 family)
MSKPVETNRSDEQQIRALVETWMRASHENDLDTVLSLMTEDVLFLTPGNAPMTREDFAAAAKPMAATQIKIDGTSDIQEVTVSGDLAFCWSRLEITATPSETGSSVRRSGTTMSVFRRGADGRWRLWRDANLLGAATPD